MRSLLTIAALCGLAAGARHFFIFLSEKEKNQLRKSKLEVWEGEGGAVPVSSDRTAAQVAPRKSSGASPGGVG